ncbi:response regulator [Maridesulfovibrio sp.]|uniref:response regulator n=1 Tax=Maridesulfovibrio sp. TaxID=2795000 RepID=UPI002A186A11|nr:response regulator [Maridesulfovibrio sp.]
MKFRIFHGSVRKKLVFLVLLATLPAFMLNFGTEWEKRQKTLDTLKLDTTIYLNSFSHVQQRITDSTKTLLQTVAAMPAVKKMERDTIHEILTTILQENPMFTNVILVDTKGDVVTAGRDTDEARQFNFSDRKQFREALQTGSFSAGQFMVGKQTRMSIFPFAMPITTYEGTYAGVMLIGVSLDDYSRLFDECSFQSGLFFGACDAYGIRIFRHPMPKGLSIGQPIQKTIFDQARAAKGSSTMELKDSSGVDRIIASTPLRLTPDSEPYMYMFMGRDSSAALSNTDSVLIRGLLTTFASLTLALLIAWFVGGRGIAGNLERMAVIAHNLGSDKPIPPSNIDYDDGEIGYLARTWDNMIAMLNKREKEKNEALAQLSESEERHRIILEHNPGGIALINPDTLEILFANPAFMTLFEIATTSLSTVTLCDLHPSKDCPRVREELNRHLRSGGGTTQEMAFRTLNGKIVLTDFSTAVLTLIGKTYLAGFFTDITERKNSEHELLTAKEMAERANVVKDDFLANISHELRTPLNGVMGMLQLLELSDLSEGQAGYVDIALKSSNSLRRVIDDLLDFTKIEAGMLDIREEPFDLENLLRQCVDLLRVQADEKGLQLTWNVHPGTNKKFLGDTGRLRQILFNLLGNAIKFTETGLISIESFTLPSPEESRERLFLSVTDTGVGIPDDRIKDIFESFTQVDGSRTRKYQGVGLGLSIVKRLVSLMNGSMTIESEPGMGTRVQFCVSVGSCIQVEDTDEEEPLSGHLDRKLKLLLVEDEKVNMFMAKHILEKMGHDVDCAENGRQCLAQIARQPYDAVLMDIQMPEMTGIEATRRIRFASEFESVSSIPIIALSAHATSSDVEAAMRAGVNEYITKPFERARLEEALQKIGSNLNFSRTDNG